MSEPNPYQSPVSFDQPSELDGFYTSKLTALRYGELWRLSSTWSGFLNVTIAKAFRLPFPSNSAFKALDPVVVLDESELPERARVKLLPVVESWLELGLRLAYFSTIERRDQNEGYAADFLDQSGAIIAATHWIRVRAGQIVREQLSSFAQSWLYDGIVLSTSNQRRQLDAPEMFQRMHVPGASIAELLRLHSERLQTIPPGRVQSLDRDGLLERRNANKRAIAEFHIRRGFWVPKAPETVTVSAIT